MSTTEEPGGETAETGSSPVDAEAVPATASGQPERDENGQSVRWLTAGEQDTWLAVREFMWGYPAAVDRQLARDNALGTGEYSVLATLSAAPDHRLRAGVAAADLGWERSRLSHLLRRMESKGYIRRLVSSTDRRGQDVELTEEGLSVLEGAAPAHVTFIRESLFDPLSPEEQGVLASALRRIKTATEDRGLW